MADETPPEELPNEDIAAVVAAWTGIPVARLKQGETEKLLSLESELGRRLIGQKQAEVQTDRRRYQLPDAGINPRPDRLYDAGGRISSPTNLISRKLAFGPWAVLLALP